jgi:hypothetical protein
MLAVEVAGHNLEMDHMLADQELGVMVAQVVVAVVPQVQQILEAVVVEEHQDQDLVDQA